MNTRSSQPASGGAVIVSKTQDPAAAHEPQERANGATVVQSPTEMQKAELASLLEAQRKRSANVAVSIAVIGFGVALASMGSSLVDQYDCSSGYYSGTEKERLCKNGRAEERAGVRMISDGSSQLTSDSDGSRSAFFKQYGGGGARYGGFGGSGSWRFSGGG